MGQENQVNTLPVNYLLHGRYQIRKVIGQGGFGITYLAWDREYLRPVAIKEYFPGQGAERDEGSSAVSFRGQGDEDAYIHAGKRFLEEARLLNSLKQYREILQIYHMFPDNGTAYYVMELLDGEDLRKKILVRNGMEWGELSEYVKEILRTLRILHSHDLIHRDISPDNIFIDKKQGAKLIDFGSARNYASSRGLTVILKEAYAPMEQWESEGDQGPWTDLYSLSVTIYTALAGYGRSSSGRLLIPVPSAPSRQVDREPVVPLRKRCPDLPEHVAAAIMKGLEMEIDDRFQSAEEMADALFPDGSWRERRTVPSPKKPGTWVLECVGGRYKNKKTELPERQVFSVGRGPGNHIAYPQRPEESPGISRKHFQLYVDERGRLLFQDTASGDTVVNRVRLQKNVWYELQRGSSIAFAGEVYRVY